jgi:phospholipid/cholesterol/gamma-HCH transport system ATP-binding protein
MSAAIPTSGLATVRPPGDQTPVVEFPVVEFKDVTISFDVKPVLENISFSVDRGQTLIILGPAGCGKSVLLKLANGLLKPDSGSIRIFGQEITTMPERDLYALRAHIGMVFQESALFDSLSVEDNVAYRLHEEHVPEDEAHHRVVEALQFVELEQAIAKLPPELSGGMRRRVSIARAIISNPDLILYDSPTGGLDPITSTTIIELVMKQRDVSHSTSPAGCLRPRHPSLRRRQRHGCDPQGRSGPRHRPRHEVPHAERRRHPVPRRHRGTRPFQRPLDCELPLLNFS